MLTLPMRNSPRLRVADMELDPSRIARSTTDFATHELPALVRRADVPGRLETGMDAASDVIRAAVERLPGQRRRSPWRAWTPGIAIVGVLAVIAIAGWRTARGAALSAAQEMDQELDEDALARGANEGMTSDLGVGHTPDHLAPGITAPASTPYDRTWPGSSASELEMTRSA